MRDTIKKNAPEFVRNGVHFLRNLLAGPGVDEATLKALRFVADEPQDLARLNFVLPSLSAKNAFGGVHTAIELFLDLAIRLNTSKPFDLRFIVDVPSRKSDDVLEHYRERTRSISRPIEVVTAQDRDAVILTRKNDIFMTFNWWTNINIMPVIESQAKHFGIVRRPRIYLIQDYEPGFFPFSSSHLYALHAYNAPDGVYGIFNSSLLYEYYLAQKNSVEKAFVFEPKIPEEMRPFQNNLQSVSKKKMIIIYGRPNVERNCFSIIMAGLRKFTERHSYYSDWKIISVGTRHKRIAIGNGRYVESVGKLSIEEYAKLLQDAAIGVSLMASPHPSYPPLEMAHFGLLTITNRYANKNLAKMHENIISLNDIMPDALAECLAGTCSDFEKNPRVGILGKALVTSYLSGRKFECLEDLAASILNLIEA